MMASAAPSTMADKNRKVARIAAGCALAMLGLGYASVPLYRMFCQATGLNGTTQRSSAEQASAVKVSGQPITVRFDSNLANGMPWVFRPEQVSQDGKIGERKMAFFIAKNLSDRPMTGRASFNVTPEQTGVYFHKIQCFCFNEQTLQPGQEVRMPVIYYVDPDMMKDPNARNVPEITLSYTFLEAADSISLRSRKTGAKPLDRVALAR